MQIGANFRQIVTIRFWIWFDEKSGNSQILREFVFIKKGSERMLIFHTILSQNINESKF